MKLLKKEKTLVTFFKYLSLFVTHKWRHEHTRKCYHDYSGTSMQQSAKGLSKCARCKKDSLYTSSFSYITDFTWAFLGDHTQVLKEKEKFVVACLRTP